jgi:hypothetical protein
MREKCVKIREKKSFFHAFSLFFTKCAQEAKAFTLKLVAQVKNYNIILLVQRHKKIVTNIRTPITHDAE